MLFFAPLPGMAIGAAGGAIGGALSGKAADYGVDDDLMKHLGEQFTLGTSALFLLVRKVTPDKVIDELKQYGGTVLQTSLTREQEQALQDALSGRESA